MKKKSKQSGGRLRALINSPKTSAAAFLLAAVLILLSGIGGARSAMIYLGDYYSSQIGMHHIGVTLQENGQDLSWRNYSGKADGKWTEHEGVLLANLLTRKDEDGKLVKDKDGNPVKDPLKIGYPYEEKITVKNSSGANDEDGTKGINQFVRVTIYTYWLKPADKNGSKEKATNRDPKDIDLHLVNTSEKDSPWILDKTASTQERTVLYYRKLLKNGATTEPLSDTITVKPIVARKVTQREKVSADGKTITTSYDYDGYSFAAEVTVDAVQEHNAADAILSAWGRKVKISGTGDAQTLSLVNSK